MSPDTAVLETAVPEALGAGTPDGPGNPSGPGPPPATGPQPGDVRALAADPAAARRATAAMLGSRVVIAVLGWVGSVIIARQLSPDAWGHYSFVFALLGLMAIITDLGVGRAVLARLLDDDPAEVSATASSFVALRIMLGALGYAFALLYVVVLQYPGEVIRATAVGGLVIVFATPGHALTVLFQSRHRLLLSAVAESLGQAVQLAITIAAAIVAPYLLLFVLAPVVNEVLALLMKALGIRGDTTGLRPSRRVDFARWTPMLRDAAPLAVGFALTIALLKIDVLLLSLLDTFDAVGQYSIGYKFSDIIDTFALAAAAPVSTLLVAAWPDRVADFRSTVRDAAIAFAVTGAVAVAGFWPSAEEIIRLLYGERFVAAAGAARLLVVGAALMALIVLAIFLLAAAGRQRHYPVVAAGGLALNVAANLVLIPRYSYNGAAVATVLTLAVTVVAVWIVVARTLPLRELFPLMAVLGLAAVTAVVCVAGTVAVHHVPWPIVSALAVLVVLAPVAAWYRAIRPRIHQPRHRKVLR